MKCENCGNEHDGSYGSGRFCCFECKQNYCSKPKSNKEYKCKFCGYIATSPRSLAGHVAQCKLNPLKKSALEKRSKTVKLKNSLINPKNFYTLNCIECGHSYTIQIKLKQYISGKYSHFCSKHCARVFAAKHTDYNKVSASLKRQKVIETRKCKWCGILFNIESTHKQQCCCGAHSQRYNSLLKYQKILNLTTDQRELVQIKLKIYRKKCQFSFSLDLYPDEFDFDLIKKYGWYKAKNRGNNPNGISRDHMYSIKDGFLNGVDPKIISHPANCQLIQQPLNAKKQSKSCITLDQLKERIRIWDEKYKN